MLRSLAERGQRRCGYVNGCNHALPTAASSRHVRAGCDGEPVLRRPNYKKQHLYTDFNVRWQRLSAGVPRSCGCCVAYRHEREGPPGTRKPCSQVVRLRTGSVTTRNFGVSLYLLEPISPRHTQELCSASVFFFCTDFFTSFGLRTSPVASPKKQTRSDGTKKQKMAKRQDEEEL